MRHAGRWFIGIWFLAIVIGVGFAPLRLANAAESSGSAALDGLVFYGQLGIKGQDFFDDTLSFAEGKLWSGFCIRCGLKPGKYWTRVEADGIHFRGTLENKHGTFIYEGRVIDGQAIADVTWEKKRWYWTSSRTLEFSGSTRAGEIPISLSLANQIALDATAAKYPEICR